MLEDLFSVVKTRFNGIVEEVYSAETVKPEKKVDIPKDMVYKCPRCSNVVMTDELVKNLKVCPSCNYHTRITAWERINLI